MTTDRNKVAAIETHHELHTAADAQNRQGPGPRIVEAPLRLITRKAGSTSCPPDSTTPAGDTDPSHVSRSSPRAFETVTGVKPIVATHLMSA